MIQNTRSNNRLQRLQKTAMMRETKGDLELYCENTYNKKTRRSSETFHIYGKNGYVGSFSNYFDAKRIMMTVYESRLHNSATLNESNIDNSKQEESPLLDPLTRFQQIGKIMNELTKGDN